ncbi:MAG: hypothetical protein HY823_03300 [Acidobacteria bacterium]|nr:hypothetical protein [Acidobacteriota bacterium]
MNAPERNPPLTPMEKFRGLLSAFEDSEAGREGLARGLQQVGPQGLGELGARLTRPGTPRTLKKAILALVSTFDWPEWGPLLATAMQSEQDLGIFDQGIAALASLGTQDSAKALDHLSGSLGEAQRQLILQRERSRLAMHQPLEFYLARLLEGSGNPKSARQAAGVLAANLDDRCLEPLLAALRKGNPLTRNLSLRLLDAFGSAEVGAALLERLDQLRQSFEDASLGQGERDQASIQVAELAEALARRCLGGLPPGRDRVVAVFLGCFRSRAGGSALQGALARLVEPGDQETQGEILADPDPRSRIRTLNAIGVREEDGFAPFFLKAVEDPFLDVAHTAMHHLDRLPSGFGMIMDLFHSPQADRVRRAIQVFGENRSRAAAENLMAFLAQETRDELLQEAVEALGAIVHPPAAGPLLEMLHDGKPLNLQLALTRALGGMATPEACLGLLDRAPRLKIPQVLGLALEGVFTAFPSFARPFPLDRIPDLLGLAERCFDEREGEGQRLRAIFALQDLFVLDRAVYERLKDRVSDFLSELRTSPSWDRELNDKVAGAIKEFGRRALNLSRLEDRERSLVGAFKKLPAGGQTRVDGLLQLRDALLDPELILRKELAGELARFIRSELEAPGKEWRETARLCEIGGLTGEALLVEPIREVFIRATGLGLRAAAKEALLRLGLSEGEIHTRAPIKSILLLEPSGFFRKRLLGVLEGRGFRVAQAGDRQEAELALRNEPVDLLVSEFLDASGEMGGWLEEQWRTRRIRDLVLATTARSLGPLGEAPWLLGVLFKPFQAERLLEILESP